MEALPESLLVHKILSPWLDALELVKTLSVVSKHFHFLSEKALKFSSSLVVACPIGTKLDPSRFFSSLLQPCASANLKHLGLQDCLLLNNETVQEISRLLPGLSSLSIIRCSNITSLKEVPFDGLLSLETDVLHGSDILAIEQYIQLNSLRLIGLIGVDDHERLCYVLQSIVSLDHLEIENGKDMDEEMLQLILSDGIMSRLKCLKVIGYINCSMKSVKWPNTLPKLEELVIDGPHIDHTSAANISQAFNLKHLDLGCNCSTIGDDGLKSLAETCRNLRSIKMQNVSHFGFSLFAENCPLLESLTAHDCKGVGDLTLINLGNRCRRLRKLDVQGCKGVSDQGVVGMCTPGAPHPYDPNPTPELPANLVFPGKSLNIAQNMKWDCKITHLNLSGCTALTNKALKAIGECKSIIYLNLNGLYRLTDGGFIAFAEKCNTLIHLDVSWCFNLTLLSLEILVNSIPPLKTIELEGCSGLHADELKNLELLIRQKFKKQFLQSTTTNANISNGGERGSVPKRTKKKAKPKSKKGIPDFDAILNSKDTGNNAATGKNTKVTGKTKAKTKGKSGKSVKSTESSNPKQYVAFQNLRNK